MKKTMVKRLFVSIVLALGATALSAQTHWSYTYGTYPKDMRIFFELKKKDVVLDLDDYEVAAFIGDECRGIAIKGSKDVDALTIYYGRIQIEAESAEEGAAITFKAYDKAAAKEIDITTDVAYTFTGDAIIGAPSGLKQFELKPVLKGDVNGDEDVDIADAVCIVNYVVDKPNTNFIDAAADANGDGDIDIADAVHIVNYVVGKIPALAPRFEWNLAEPE